MNRRQFLQVSTALAASPSPADTPIPHRGLGKTGMDVAILAEEQPVLLTRTGKGPFGSQVEQYKKKENA